MKKIKIIFITILFFVATKSIAQVDSTKIKNPKIAVTSAILCPGAGQVYNESWLKAFAIIGVESFFIYQANYYNEKQIEEHAKFGTDEYNSLYDDFYLDTRNKYIWYSAGIYLYGIVDAIVDAHLSGFPEGDIVFYGDKNSFNLSLSINF